MEHHPRLARPRSRCRALLAIAAACLSLAACHRVPRKAPPRATGGVSIPTQASTIAVPITAELGALGQALDDAVPSTLWTIDKPDQVCAAPSKVKVLFARIKTPKIKCRLVGKVTRGPLAVSGAGQEIVVTMPLHATINAKDIGGIVKNETANADATVRARVRLDLARDWTPRATAKISYDWTDAPHVDLLGQRIEFTDKADDKLKGVIANLQRKLPRELAKLHFRDRAEQAWRSAFTSLQLNDSDPPVWMRISPRELDYGGYEIARNVLTLRLGMKALTETFVGQRPPDPPPTALPPLNRVKETSGDVVFAIPVLAAYDELEPVLAKALAKRSRRPFQVPGLGPVTASFGRVVAYGTTGGRIAVGLTFTAAPPGYAPAHGTVWLTARPDNAVNSRQVSFSELTVAGVTDSTRTRLLLKLANAPGLSATIADALTQDFSKDYDDLLGKVTHAIAEKKQGDLLIRAHLREVRTGKIMATGQGIFLPVAGRGNASISLER